MMPQRLLLSPLLVLSFATGSAQAGPSLIEHYGGAAATVAVTDRDGVVQLANQTDSVVCTYLAAHNCDLRYRLDSREVSTAEAQLQQGRAESSQNMVGGYVHDVRSAFSNHSGQVAAVEVRASTVYGVVLRQGFGTPTDLIADFIWGPSLIDLRSHYGDARVQGSLSVGISVSRNGQPAQRVWGFDDRIDGAPGQPWVYSQQDFDLTGAGLPQTRTREGWESFHRFATMERLGLLGHLDLGTLTRGETFSLEYWAYSRVRLLDVRYDASAHAQLWDPLTLGQAPMISFRGVNFGDGGNDPATVPVPGSLGLALLAVAGVGAARRTNRS